MVVMKDRVTTDGDNGPTVIAKGMMCWCIVNQDGIFIIIILATKHVSDSSLIRKYFLKSSWCSDTDLFLDSTEIEKVLKKHNSDLRKLIGEDLAKLANDLWSKDLLKDEGRSYVLTASGVSSIHKSSYLMMKFYESLSSVKNVTAQKEIFIKFCDVLLDQESPSLDRIAKQIKDELQHTH